VTDTKTSKADPTASQHKAELSNSALSNTVEHSSGQNLIAAIDLGSNSFHLVIAKEDLGEVRALEKHGEKVRLAAGLDEHSELTEEAQQRGFDCLRAFASRIAGIPNEKVSILATNALREAVNRKAFIDTAEGILGHPISIISGREEARLIYNGVAHTTADTGGKRLVVDIGGGSTEFIIGAGFTPIVLESLHMGCVSFTQRFFANGQLTEKAFKKAITAAKQEISNIRTHYRAVGWDLTLGASGTVRAIERICSNLSADEHEGIYPQCLTYLKKALIEVGHIDDFDAPQVKANRKPTLAAGLSILIAIFEALGIEHMSYADGALREGALYELIGKTQHEDVQARTVRALQERFHVDLDQIARIKQTALTFWSEIEPTWGQRKLPEQEWLGWAADLHTIGLAIAHSQFHKHGAYILSVADMLGFNRQTQQVLAFLVRAHRRKFPTDALLELPTNTQLSAKHLAAVLRLAVLIHHAQDPTQLPNLSISVRKNTITLHFDQAIDQNMPLTYYDFVNEQTYLESAGFELLLDIPNN
jgi:exopolyphosphatase/guanosine-5'-triphosphate,3'-diphosphate pyrophosphatase